MKRFFVFFLALVLMFSCSAIGETAEDWSAAPVITCAYEIAKGEIYLEWEGNAPFYGVQVAGKKEKVVNQNSATVKVEEGRQSISVRSLDKNKDENAKGIVDLDINALGGLHIDTDAFGLNSKNMIGGKVSKLDIDYSPSKIHDTMPEKLNAFTDSKGVVHFSFVDLQYADEYKVSIKIGDDVSEAVFGYDDPASAALVTKNNTTVTLRLEPDFLIANQMIVPEMETEYIFTVQLRKNAVNLVGDGKEKIKATSMVSEVSKAYHYKPVAPWKTAPVISYASQTADGQVTLQWEHDDTGLGCEYVITQSTKKLGIRTNEKTVGTTKEHSFVINDMMNGNYSFVVSPKLANEQGTDSAYADVTIQNDWVVAPVLNCEAKDEKSVRLSWTAAEGVESYHIVVSKGDSESLLRFVDLDYEQYAEYDLEVVPGEMEYFFTYDETINPETGVKFKFEVYGIRHAENGEEQKTAPSSKSLTIGQQEQTAE